MQDRLTLIAFNIKQALTSKIFLIPLITVLSFALLSFFALKKLPPIERRILSLRKRVHTQFCAGLVPGIPQEKLSPEQKSGFGETAGTLPKCGEILRFVDAETNSLVTPASSAIRIEASGFSATDCDRAEVTLRLVKEGQVVWEKKEVDSSCSVSEEGKPLGNYVISPATPSALPVLSGTELEACFDLINKSGRRASQNAVSSCEILAFVPQLCQKIPLPNAWR